jgi:hypothetical protein
MPSPKAVLLLLACCLALLAPPARADAPIPIAVFPFTIQDTSGTQAAGRAERLAAATRLLAKTLAQTGRYKPVDLAPYGQQIAALQPPDECGECWAALARKAGATQMILPSVQMVSVLISQMTMWVADVDTMKYLRHIQGQIRGDTTEAYTRGIEFLVNDELMKAPRG